MYFYIVSLCDHDASHLPHGHLPVVGVGVGVPLDRGQVGVEGEEGGRRQSFLQAKEERMVRRKDVILLGRKSRPNLLSAPQTRRDGHEPKLVKHLQTKVVYFIK